MLKNTKPEAITVDEIEDVKQFPPAERVLGKFEGKGVSYFAYKEGKFIQIDFSSNTNFEAEFKRLDESKGKIFANSSPKAEGESLMWPAFKSTSQYHFYVKCPKCKGKHRKKDEAEEY